MGSDRDSEVNLAAWLVFSCDKAVGELSASGMLLFTLDTVATGSISHAFDDCWASSVESHQIKVGWLTKWVLS